MKIVQFAIPERVFPSPQGGSETEVKWVTWWENERFPSPQGGSETYCELVHDPAGFMFPSPQGGSETQPTSQTI